MNTPIRRSLLLSLLAVGLLAAAGASANSDWRLRGSLEGWTYGYQNAQNIHHVWFGEQTNLSLYRSGTPWSVHASGGWVGDYENNEGFTDEGRARFTRGYIRYGRFGQGLRAKLGRFFLVRGPAIGVLDGLDVQYTLGNGISLAAFGGIWGPYSREFEFESPDESSAFGGEVGWTGRDVLFSQRTHVAVSYANIEREAEALRHRVGLRTYHRFDKNITWYNIARFRVEGASPVQRVVSRVRQTSDVCSRMLEFGYLSPEMPETSWFNDFDEMPGLVRLRGAADRWIVQDMWGLGFDAAALLSEQSGYRVGPYLKFPFGRIGYRFYFGDQPTAPGLWAQVSYDPLDYLELYAYGSLADYEWEAFESDVGEVMSLYAGTRIRAPFAPKLSLNLEYQHYQTPQLDQDRRAMAGLRWAFDTAEGIR